MIQLTVQSGGSRSDGAGGPSNPPWEQTAKTRAKVMEVFVEHGADPNVVARWNQCLPGYPRLSPIVIVEMLPESLASKTAGLKLLLNKGARDDQLNGHRGG